MKRAENIMANVFDVAAYILQQRGCMTRSSAITRRLGT